MPIHFRPGPTVSPNTCTAMVDFYEKLDDYVLESTEAFS